MEHMSGNRVPNTVCAYKIKVAAGYFVKNLKLNPYGLNNMEHLILKTGLLNHLKYIYDDVGITTPILPIHESELEEAIGTWLFWMGSFP